MEFDTYAGRAVLTAVDLVNSDDTGADAVTALLTRRGWVLEHDLGEGQLARFAALRRKLRDVFDTQANAAPADASADEQARAALDTRATGDTVAKLNAILADRRALPQLTNHDGGWHWHYLPRGGTPDNTADRVATTCAAALLGVIARDGGASRLRTCTAEGCRNAFVDASRNGKRRFCDNRTCGNRTHAAAYRARQTK